VFMTYSTLIDIYSKVGMHGDAFNVYLDFKESGLRQMFCSALLLIHWPRMAW
jgi:pentatricopeptide repeat protein